ncbi:MULTISPECIES: hypothetical protein [Nostocales]|uniref:hypothetical protein n=1 Tax=Nostocales TaxID=1161 RepID=UPI00029B70D4|nr:MULTISPECIES: hypothetical protein [Nostocales]AFW96347.1 hypothetical protein ANA_C13694 [Anabaena sp. 90]MBO1053699.1 hypothetical protein [Dolichospermum sp. DET73]MTJ38833.1 hypothetical protein [Dolichospermum sp. UHCC 0406]
MENWQFLIQKQGDRTWRTLESPNLTILADNYRVLARSYLNNMDVDVRVTYISTQEVPPKRRILKRSHRTNSEGLMAVIPFTYFKPGIWELRCSGDIMSEMLGKSWQHTLLIQVSPPEPSPQSLTQLAEESDLASNADTQVSIVMNHGTPVWFKGETTEQILQNLLDLALPQDEPLLDEETIENAPTLPPPLALNLSLDQDTYVARWGDNFIIHGDVEVNEIENLEDERFAMNGVSQLRLEITLRSPSESRILNHIDQPLTDQVLPFSFSTLIDIPLDCESKLLLAEINLYGALADVGEVILLANHTFTITADITDLLALQTSRSDYRDYSLPETNPPVKPKPSVKIRLELFNVAKSPKLAQFHILKPSPNQPLPPQIKPLISWQFLSPQLPNLPHNPRSEINTDSETDSLTKTLAIHPIDLKKLVIKPVNTIFPYLKRLKVKPVPGKTANDQLNVEKLATLQKSPQLPTIVTLPAKIPELPVDNLPQSDQSMIDDTSYAELIAEIVAGVTKSEELDLVDSQENSVIIQSEELDLVDSQENSVIIQSEGLDLVDSQENSSLLQQWIDSQGYLLTEAVFQESSDNDLGEETQTVDVEVLLSREKEIQEDPIADNIPLEINKPETVNILNPIPTEPGWLSQEIVIDDLVMEWDADSWSDEAIADHHYSPLPENETAADFSGVMMESLPTPQLYLSEGELVAGTSVMVRVKLPEVSSSVVVKLWVEDYQTRSLLDRPHILPDLRSNACGEWETAIYLKIPFGCLEIRLSAIALHQTTQQESDKFTIIKTVIPPNLPRIEMDEMLGM